MTANSLTNGKRPQGASSQASGAPPSKRKPSLKRRVGGSGRTASPGTARGLALELLSWRRRREQLFGAHMFSEPVWDMMLDLLVHHEQGRLVNVTSLCVASMASFSTALRWIQAMEKEGFVVREPDPHDRRQILVRPTPAFIARFRQFLEAWAAASAIRSGA
jgi:DNA-binding MarR family transcriptional regulator